MNFNPKDSISVCTEIHAQWTAKHTGKQLQLFKTLMNSGINIIMQHDWQIAYLKARLPQYWTRAKERSIAVRYAVKLPMWAADFTLYKDMTIEESARNVDHDTAQPIKHTQIKWTNYTAAPWICTLTGLAMLISFSEKILKDKVWKEILKSGGIMCSKERNVKKKLHIHL